MRNWEVLSITTQPSAAAFGANSFAQMAEPGEKQRDIHVRKIKIIERDDFQNIHIAETDFLARGSERGDGHHFPCRKTALKQRVPAFLRPTLPVAPATAIL